MLMNPVDFTVFDRPGQATRLRLGATAVQVGHVGKAGGAEGVQIVYEKGGKLHKVRGRRSSCAAAAG
jgi:hypothetical protein